jgi:hypothetical protein
MDNRAQPDLEAIADKRPPMPRNFKWYSICSGCSGVKLDGHYNPACGRCNTGHWVNDELQEFSHWLYKHNPKLWREWANRETTPAQPGHAARHFLETIFPGLRKKANK